MTRFQLGCDFCRETIKPETDTRIAYSTCVNCRHKQYTFNVDPYAACVALERKKSRERLQADGLLV